MSHPQEAADIRPLLSSAFDRVWSAAIRGINPKWYLNATKNISFCWRLFPNLFIFSPSQSTVTLWLTNRVPLELNMNILLRFFFSNGYKNRYAQEVHGFFYCFILFCLKKACHRACGWDSKCGSWLGSCRTHQNSVLRALSEINYELEQHSWGWGTVS